MAANFVRGHGHTLSAEEQLQDDIVDAAQKLSLTAFIKFLRPLLEPSSRAAWTATSLATATHRLSKVEGDFNEQPDLASFFELLAGRLKALRGTLDAQGVSGAFYGLSKVRTTQLAPNIRVALVQLLDALVEAAKRSRDEFNSQCVGMAFYGLHGIRTEDLNDSGRSVIAETLALLARKVMTGPKVMTAQNIAMAFYGLQNIRTGDLDESGNNALAKALGALALQLDKCPEELTSSAVVQVFQGIKGIDSSTFNEAGRKALRYVLEILATKLRASTQWLQPDDIESAIDVVAEVIGTPCEDALNQAAVALHVVLTEKLNTRTDGLQLENVLRAVATLRRFDTASLPAHLRALLAASLGNLADAAERCRSASLTANAIANAFFGLQGMEIGSLDEPGRKAVVRLVKVLAAKTRECEERFDTQAVGMAFLGLQGFDVSKLDDYGRKVVCEALAALTDKTRTSSEPLNFLCVNNVFVGIRGLLPSNHSQTKCTSNAEVNTRALNAAEAVFSQMTGEVARHAAQSRGLAAVLQALHETDPTCCVSQKDDLLQRLDAFWDGHTAVVMQADQPWIPALLESQQAYALYERPLPAGLTACLMAHKVEVEKLCSPSPQEKECQWVLEELLTVPVRLNQLVDGFELAVVFELDGRLYNVESDGPTHLKLSQKLRDKQRDEFLSSKGYEIIRVARGLSPQQVAEQVLEHVAERS